MKTAIMVVCHNEALYIDEWIMYHLMLGIDTILFYDNMSTDYTFKYLEPYIRLGKVIYNPLNHPILECNPHRMDCIHNHGSKFDFIIFIDMDEFLYCHDLSTFFSQINKNVGTIQIPGILIGDKNIHPRKGYVTLNYNKFIKDMTQFKVICRPGAVTNFPNAHTANIKNKLMQKNIFLTGPGHDGLIYYHYTTKSLKEFLTKNFTTHYHDNKKFDPKIKWRKYTNQMNHPTNVMKNMTIKLLYKFFAEYHFIACLELHTFSSLSKKFLPHYKGSMNRCDVPLLYFNPHAVEMKKLEMPRTDDIIAGFGNTELKVFTDAQLLKKEIHKHIQSNTVILYMSSGNFDGMKLV